MLVGWVGLCWVGWMVVFGWLDSWIDGMSINNGWAYYMILFGSQCNMESEGENGKRCIFDTDDDMDCEDEPFLIDEPERKMWKIIMQHVLNRMGGLNIDDITDDNDNLKEFVEKLREVYETWREIICRTKNKKIYSSIKETIDAYEGNGYLPTEASAKAWKDRRLFIKKLLPVIFS